VLWPSNPTGKTTIADVIARHAVERPVASAFVAGEERMNWLQYRDWSDRLAGAFIDCGIARGERVAILLRDGCEVHAAFVACEKAGVVGVGISARAGDAEIEHLLRVSGAGALLSEPEHRGAPTEALYGRLQHCGLPLRHHLTIRAALSQTTSIWLDASPLPTPVGALLQAAIDQRRCGPDDLFLLNSTSGTSGMPKCVTQHQRRWFCFAEYAEAAAALSPDDVFLCAVPASVGFGLWSGHFAPTLLGAPTVLLPRFSVESLLTAIQAHRVSVLAAVSTQFMMMLNAPDLARYDLRSLRVLFTGGEAVPADKAAHFEEVTGAKVLQFYGSNETGALSCTTVRDSRERRLTTAGHVIEAMQVRLLDPQSGAITEVGRGQPICKGALTCKGYFNNDEGNRDLYTADAWMKMEDVVTIDGEGYLTVVGRVGDFIIRGGKNISAATVEQAVLKHPHVTTAAAVAMPDPVFGERVCVYATLTPGTTLTVTDLAAFLQAQGVSSEWCPERLIVLDELPTVSGGKVAKHLLRADIKTRTAAPSAQDSGEGAR
jgi:acyl-CoA synthetase